MSEYMTITDYFKEQKQIIEHDYIMTLFFLLIIDVVNTIVCIITAFSENPFANLCFLLTAYNSIGLSYCIIFYLVKINERVKGLNSVLLHELYRNKEND